MVSLLKGLFSKRKPGIGIELSTERINVVELRKKGNQLKLVTLAVTPVPEGIVQDCTSHFPGKKETSIIKN